jgi:glycosyltransferase involved in cell wall biosynthesis
MAGFMQSKRVSVIIPAYNESASLGNVLAVARRTEILAEVIVVDDGSTDGTFAEAQKSLDQDSRQKCLRHASNLGKAQALLTGVNAACGELIVFLDADLYRLQPRHILDLISPVLEGRAEMAIGIFDGGKWNTDLSQRLTPWLSGQRCLPRALIFQVPFERVQGYGIETAFTVMARRLGWRVQWVKLGGVYHQATEQRRGLPKGIWMKVKMYGQIIRTYFALRDEG